MSDNRNPEAAWTYHDATKHSYVSIRTNPHFLDWRNQPLPFKIYPTLEALPLPREVRQTGVAALSAIAESVPAQSNASPDLGPLPNSSTSPRASPAKGNIPAENST